MIPEDIRLAARDVSRRMAMNVDDDGRAYLYDEDVDEIARAILAERERCAKVADRIGEQYGADETGWYDCSDAIAETIRRGNTP